MKILFSAKSSELGRARELLLPRLMDGRIGGMKFDEDNLVQKTTADYLRDHLGWESVFAYNEETFGPTGTLGRKDQTEVVLMRYLREALQKFNPRSTRRSLWECDPRYNRDQCGAIDASIQSREV